MIDLRFHPLTEWPARSTPADKRRSRNTFKASWAQTLELLETELTKLQAADVVVSAALQPEHIRIDGWPRAGAVPRHPGIMLSFVSKAHGSLRYLTDTHEWWQHNLRSIGLGLQALRAVDRYGITQSGEQYKGWAAIEQTSGSSLEAQALLLRVSGWDRADSGAPAEITELGVYKKALKVAHPDHGGTADLLAEVMEAGRKLGVA